MRIKKKSKSKRIVEAAIQDGAGYFIGLIPGLSWFPIPIETLKVLRQLRQESSPFNYVDWELKNWPKIYYKELNSVVFLNYRGKKFFLPQVLFLNNIDRKLELTQVDFQIQKEPFELLPQIKALTEKSFEHLWRSGNFYNEQHLRLLDIIEKNSKHITLLVQPVEYRSYVHTNLVLDASKGNAKTLREHIHRDGELEKLSNSQLANTLGIDILLFTADGSLVMQERSGKVAFRRGELCPSASGGISRTDIPLDGISLEEMPKLREAFEEIGIGKEDVKEIFFLGITRELIRGGQPEMFFFARTNLSERQIREKWEHARDKWETKKLYFFSFGIENAFENLDGNDKKYKFSLRLDEFVERYVEISSIPLLTNLALWREYRLKHNQ